MRITSNLTETAVLQELGERIVRHRLESGLTQAALALEAGIAKRTLERIEKGYGAELATIIRLLRVLKLTDGVEALVPDQQASPMALLRSQGRKRQRVRVGKHSKNIVTGTVANTKLGSKADAANPTTSPPTAVRDQRSKRNKSWSWGE